MEHDRTVLDVGGGLRLAVAGATVVQSAPAGTRGAGATPDATALTQLADVLRAVPEDVFVVGEEVVVHAGAPGTRSAAAPITVEAEVPEGHVPLLVVQDEDGLLSWVLPGAGGTAVLPVEPVASGTRGLAGAAITKVFRLVSARLFDSAVATGSRRLLAWAERHRGPMLCALPTDGAGGEPVTTDQLAGPGPLLVLLHDLNVRSADSFGTVRPDLLARLQDAYGGRVVAYDHPTLSVDPAANARALAELLPPDVVVDAIGHGRGGLVARELARCDGVTVRTVTFLGTPNLGTPLCDPAHLGAYLDVMTNVLGRVPGAGDVLEGLVGIAAHLASTAVEAIPGVMAMRPDGAYLRALNAAPAPPGCRFRAVAADFEPAQHGWARRLRDVVVDRVMGGAPNDLVVPMASVWGPDLVAAGDRLERRGAVDHTTYGADDATTEALATWLGVATGPEPAPSAPADTAGARGIGEPAAAPAPAEGPAPLPPLVVEVVHGSLEHASYPVVVGHQSGAALAGAEGYADGRLGGVLSRRQFLRLYPDDLADVLEVPPGLDPRPPGVIVVGLGPGQDLTASTLVHAATQAALARLASVTDDRLAGRRADDGEGVGLSCVLFGTSPPAGLAVATSARALVEGVLRANRLVRSEAAGPAPAITHLEIVEMDEDRAAIAARSLLQREPLLRRLAARIDATQTAPVVCRPEVRSGEGGRPGARPDDTRHAAWRTMTVRRTEVPPIDERPADPALGALEMRLIADTAGVLQTVHVFDEGLVAPLLADAARRHDPHDQVHNTLFELMVPPELKGQLMGGVNLQLVLGPHVAAIPWEMLAARVDGGPPRPLCVEGGLLRQLQLGDEMRPRLRRPTGEHALVIGNPPAEPTYPSLPGATAEAIAVADLLEEHGYRVRRLIWDADGQPVAGTVDAHAAPRPAWELILDELHRHEYRIAHLAMHGTFDPDRPSASGAVIGHDRLLTAPVFRSLRVVPDFVFFNCCHLGRIDRPAASEGRFVAASVASELMAAGVRAVVAAGWAVHDEDAVSFARSLYGQLLDGTPFGEATREARTLLFLGDGDADDPAPRSSTWGAYQCYGQPGFRLVLAGNRRDGGPLDLVLRSDVERRLRELAVQAGDVRTREDRRDQLAAQRQALGRIRDHIEARSADDPGWPTPSLRVDLGEAQAAVGQLEEAIATFELVVRGRSSTYPLRVVERLANLHSRHAQALARGDGDDVAARRSFDRADELLAPLLALERTGERLALLGGTRKRRAAALAPPRHAGARRAEQEADLRAARDAYREAASRTGSTYHVLNDRQLSALLGEAPPAPGATALGGGRSGPPAAPEFVGYWDRVAVADRRLTELLEAGSVAAEVGTLGEAYERAFRERSTWRERDSTIDHLWDLARLHPDAAEANALEGLWADLCARWQGEG